MGSPSDIKKLWSRKADWNSRDGVPVILGGYALNRDFLMNIATRIKEAAGTDAGAAVSDLAEDLHLPRAAVQEVLKHLASQGQGAYIRRAFYSGPGWKERLLSSFELNILTSLRNAGKTGVDPLFLKIHGAREVLEKLVSLGLALELGENLFWDAPVLTEVAGVLLKDTKPGDELTINQVRAVTGLSRRYIIPLLNMMEARELLERQGDVRIVL